jgi:hypothetical protein
VDGKFVGLQENGVPLDRVETCMLTQIRKLITSRETPELRSNTGGDPLVSFVVIVYDMPQQAENTLHSLSAKFQRGASEADYEVIVVENESANNLSPAFIAGLPKNFSYHLRAEREPTPVHAINHGVGISLGQYVCVMIDGARMVTPGLVKNILRGHRIDDRAVVTVPGYHIGEQVQQEAVEDGYGKEQDQALIASIDWRNNGYELFDIACFSGSCDDGFFRPCSESNCISVPRAIWASLGGLDTRFNLRGGGLVNLDLYRRVLEYPRVVHVSLLGEGTFHQFHDGVTTGGEEREVRDALIGEMNLQYEAIRGQDYQRPQTTPVFLGEIPLQVLTFVHASAEPLLGSKRPVTYPPPISILSAKSAKS